MLSKHFYLKILDAGIWNSNLKLDKYFHYMFFKKTVKISFVTKADSACDS